VALHQKHNLEIFLSTSIFVGKHLSTYRRHYS